MQSAHHNQTVISDEEMKVDFSVFHVSKMNPKSPIALD